MTPEETGNLATTIIQALEQDAPQIIHNLEIDMTPQTLNFAIRVLVLTTALVFLVATSLLGVIIIRDGNTAEVTNAVQTMIYIVSAGFASSVAAVFAHVAYLKKKTGGAK